MMPRYHVLVIFTEPDDRQYVAAMGVYRTYSNALDALLGYAKKELSEGGDYNVDSLGLSDDEVVNMYFEVTCGLCEKSDMWEIREAVLGEPV